MPSAADTVAFPPATSSICSARAVIGGRHFALGRAIPPTKRGPCKRASLSASATLSPQPLAKSSLAGAGVDIRRGAVLLVGVLAHGALDAVLGARLADDLDVLDALVVRSLEDCGRQVGVRVVVGVEGLHTGDRRANVGLSGRLLGAAPEAEVRGDRDCEQDPDDDDHDQKLDQGETTLVVLLRDPLAEPLDHERTPPFQQ